MNKYILTILLILPLIHGVVIAESKQPNWEEKLLRQALIDESDLLDPFSVQFRKIIYYGQTDSTVSDTHNFQVCGELNAKNSMGGYTGWRKFGAIITAKDNGTTLVSAFLVFGLALEEVLWPDSPCATKGAIKVPETNEQSEKPDMNAESVPFSFEQVIIQNPSLAIDMASNAVDDNRYDTAEEMFSMILEKHRNQKIILTTLQLNTIRKEMMLIDLGKRTKKLF